jgi:hypothetical protein
LRICLFYERQSNEIFGYLLGVAVTRAGPLGLNRNLNFEPRAAVGLQCSREESFPELSAGLRRVRVNRSQRRGMRSRLGQRRLSTRIQTGVLRGDSRTRGAASSRQLQKRAARLSSPYARSSTS